MAYELQSPHHPPPSLPASSNLLTPPRLSFSFFFFNDPAPTEISPLPLHAPLPICTAGLGAPAPNPPKIVTAVAERCARANDMDAGVRGMNDCNAPLAGSLLRDLDCHVEEGIAVKLSSDEVGVETEE